MGPDPDSGQLSQNGQGEPPSKAVAQSQTYSCCSIPAASIAAYHSSQGEPPTEAQLNYRPIATVLHLPRAPSTQDQEAPCDRLQQHSEE